MDIATMSLQMASAVNDAAPPFTLVAGRLVAGAFGRRCCGSSGASRRSPPSSTVRGGRRDVPRVSFARGAPLLFGSADQRIEQAPRGQRNTRFAAGGRRSDLVLSRGTGVCLKTRTSMRLLREAGKLRVSGLVGGLGSDTQLYCVPCGSSGPRNLSDGTAIARRAREHVGNCTLNDG
jgi:hypothetical protein